MKVTCEGATNYIVSDNGNIVFAKMILGDMMLARQFAAAEDLLAALKAILPMAENGAATPGHEGFCGPEQSCDCECIHAAYDSERLYQARAAIRKAEGES